MNDLPQSIAQDLSGPPEINEKSLQTSVHSRKQFLWQFILCSGIAGIGSGILLDFLFMILVGVMGDFVPPRSDYVPEPFSIGEIVFFGVLFGLCIGLPLGIFQWFILQTKLKDSRVLWWIPVYIFSLTPSVIIELAATKYPLNPLTSALIIGWLIASILLGTVQWGILRKFIRRGYLLIPMNLSAVLLYAFCINIGIYLNYNLIYLIGIAFGGLLASSVYGAILGLLIIWLLKKETILAL